MIKPIPKRLLPHQIILQKRNGYSRGNTYDKELNIQYVKMELGTRTLKRADGTEIVGNGRLFFDCTNSIPNTTTFTEGDLIKFNGLTYEVSTIAILYADNPAPHHYEIGLL